MDMAGGKGFKGLKVPFSTNHSMIFWYSIPERQSYAILCVLNKLWVNSQIVPVGLLLLYVTGCAPEKPVITWGLLPWINSQPAAPAPQRGTWTYLRFFTGNAPASSEVTSQPSTCTRSVPAEHSECAIPHLPFKNLQPTADTHCKRAAGGKISNVSRPLISSFTS